MYFADVVAPKYRQGNRWQRTPLHLAIALQPSTQMCAVICEVCGSE